MYGRSRIGPIVLILLACGFLLGCPKDKPTQPPAPSKYRAPTSAADVLYNLKVAYVDKDSTGYFGLFADDFVFEVSPMDTQQDPTIPHDWNLGVEKTIHRHLFADPKLETIALDFVTGAAAADSSAYPGMSFWKVRMTGIHLAVNTRQTDGQLFTYLVPNGIALFYFKEDPTRLVDGKPTWLIARWKDEPLGFRTDPKTRQTTWGRIKSNYR